MDFTSLGKENPGSPANSLPRRGQSRSRRNASRLLSLVQLPALPPHGGRPNVKITDSTLVIWSRENGVCFLKSSDGALTVWTPGRSSTEWAWRGPTAVGADNAVLLARWIESHFEGDGQPITNEDTTHVELSDQRIWLWDPDPDIEGGVCFLKLRDGGLEVAISWAAINRGRALLTRKEARMIANWLQESPQTSNKAVRL